MKKEKNSLPKGGKIVIKQGASLPCGGRHFEYGEHPLTVCAVDSYCGSSTRDTHI